MGKMTKLGASDATRNAFLAEVQEALHSIGGAASDIASSEAHYKKALYLQQKLPNPKPQRISAIKKGLVRLQKGLGPHLRVQAVHGLLGTSRRSRVTPTL